MGWSRAISRSIWANGSDGSNWERSVAVVDLAQGDGQSLTVYVTDRAQSPPNYIFSIDALLLTADPFTPNGTVRPLPVENPTLPPIPRARHRP